MKVRNATRACSILLAVCLVTVGSPPVRAQQKDHAVSSDQLRIDVQKSAATRQANEAAVRDMFASAAGKKALNSAGIHYPKMDQAINQADDEELARSAAPLP